MPSSHTHLKSFLSFLTLTLTFALLSVTAGAQTISEPATTTKAEAIKTEAIPAEPVSSPATTQAVAVKAMSDAPDPANAKTDSAKIESAKVETVPVVEATVTPSSAPTTPPTNAAAPALPAPAPTPACKRTITADVVAIAQPYMLNRLGAAMPNALIYALRSDVRIVAGNPTTDVQLMPWKRARPIVLRANEGDCLQVTLTNLIKKPANPALAASSTPPVSLHAQGMQLVKSITDDGSFVGRNNSSLASAPDDPANQKKVYTLFAQREGTYLLYSEGDTNTTGQQLFQGLFGAVNVQPAGKVQPAGTEWGAEWYRSQVTQEDLQLAIDHSKGTNGFTPAGQPIIKYDARYPANYTYTLPDGTKDTSRRCTPILQMVAAEQEVKPNGKCGPKAGGAQFKLYHTDLTAIITGPGAGRFPGTTGAGPTAKPEPMCDKPVPPGTPFDPLFCRNPALPDRKQPYREVTVIYHEVFPSASQAFNAFWDGTNPLLPTVRAARDDFAINYGTGGIGAEIYANRIGVGPMANCVDCKYEEFFLSAWSVGDPATVVDVPANFISPPAKPDCQYNKLTPADTFKLGPPPAQNPTCIGRPKNDPPAGYKATMAYYPDDPSNVYHSYLDDHVKFRILHGGTGVTHIHHQHAHQWIQSPNSSEGSYLDSQFISPGASYTLEMVYNGSGNRNKTVGDSIFHCHFYPHFAEGMWAMWRVHDVFEAGTQLDSNGKPLTGSRALPDAEIKAGTPIPAIVPLPTMPMPLMPSPVFINPTNGQIVYGTPTTPDPTGQNVTANPGFPFFVPGIAGFRPPHPPLDFAPDDANPGQLLDGGLPRHVNTGGTSTEKHTTTDWSKDYLTLNSRQLPEDGTPVEKVAIGYHGKRCNPTFLPDGSSANPFGPQNYPECGASASQANFILNGLPRKTAQNPSGAQHGAPFADPAIKDDGSAVGKPRIYKAAAIQMDVTFNERGWHYQQQRLLTLWQDVVPTINKTRKCAGTSNPCPPEPFFFRANSEEDFIEYWHTNLVPNYYEVDDFQVRTPTDILGQHIHLVKFDVTSSDGAGNGWNYEDGTFSPDEVQEIIHAVNPVNGGSWTHCAGCPTDLRAAQPPPADICTGSQCKPEWKGAQTTIQRWYADPFIDNDGKDNTVRTVFTHDHFGPSTHQQAGLYAGLLVEPKGSAWRSNQGDVPLGTRTDGGPTSWQARIITPNATDSYREFALEFQDFTLAYALPQNTMQIPVSKINPAFGKPINPPPVPTLISTGGQPPPGTQTVNYFNAPIPFRTQGDCADLSYAFSSSCVRASGLPMNGDPLTPLLRTYENDKVQVRVLVGAHTFSHFFTIGGPKWHFEPSWSNSGYRSSQGMGLSEHFELLFNVPPSSIGKARTKCPDKYSTSSGDCVDYLYMPSNDDFGFVNGVWGLLRAYDPTKPFTELKTLPSNPLGTSASLDFQACQAGQPKKTFNITAVDAKNFVPDGMIKFNSRNSPGIQSLGFMYVFSEDIIGGKLKGPIEPLILRANAGDCIVVNLTNGISPNADPFTSPLPWPQPFFIQGQAPVIPSKYVGIQPQLLSYDGATTSGMNVGFNAMPQTVAPGKTTTFNWYAGNIGRTQNGSLTYTPVEFGSLNLLPTDFLMQHQWALFGGMVIEPAGVKWTCDGDSTGKTQVPCEPGTPGYDPSKIYSRASANVFIAPNTVLFRDFVVMVNEDLLLNASNRSGINYRTEPTPYRYGHISPEPQTFAANGNNTCAISNTLIPGDPLSSTTDPVTPIFTAKVGTPVRFRLMHPQGTGTAQVFTINGHVWQREPYISDSALIGDNQLSQWLGSHDSHGGTDHYDIVIDKAGGQFGVGVLGDYLYTTFLPNQNALGSWGIFRVVDKDGNPVVPPTKPVCPTPITRPEPRAPERDQNDFIRQPFGKAVRQDNNR
ncbi:MAG: manganese oxidase [Acidobacteriota bacterium]|jgi:hypothetical protein|nr:manganese oxidase [Acidobacteriota bacterium]